MQRSSDKSVELSKYEWKKDWATKKARSGELEESE